MEKWATCCPVAILGGKCRSASSSVEHAADTHPCAWTQGRNIPKTQTWTNDKQIEPKKKRQQNALGGFFTPWRVCTLLVARCSLRWGFWGFGSARCFISSCRISLRKASTWRQHGSTCHVIMSTCQPHYNTLSSCTSRVRHVKAEVTDSWEIFIRIDKVTKQYSRDSWKKKANKVVKIHELCWCLPFQESCMPMSWLWRDSKTPHGFYLIKLRKFQLKKRTVSFSTLADFSILLCIPTKATPVAKAPSVASAIVPSQLHPRPNAPVSTTQQPAEAGYPDFSDLSSPCSLAWKLSQSLR